MFNVYTILYTVNSVYYYMPKTDRIKDAYAHLWTMVAQALRDLRNTQMRTPSVCL